jgi:hypothetical protein
MPSRRGAPIETTMCDHEPQLLAAGDALAIAARRLAAMASPVH